MRCHITVDFTMNQNCIKSPLILNWNTTRANKQTKSFEGLLLTFQTAFWKVTRWILGGEALNRPPFSNQPFDLNGHYQYSRKEHSQDSDGFHWLDALSTMPAPSGNLKLLANVWINSDDSFIEQTAKNWRTQPPLQSIRQAPTWHMDILAFRFSVCCHSKKSQKFESNKNDTEQNVENSTTWRELFQNPPPLGMLLLSLSQIRQSLHS